MSVLKKFFKIIHPDDRSKIYFLMFLSLIGMGLETFGVSMIIPLLVMLSQSSSLPQPVLGFLEKFDVDLNNSEAIIAFLIFMVLFFVIKFLFLLFLVYKQSLFTYGLQTKLSTFMFKGYLLSSYSFHLKHNTTEFIRNVIGEVSQFTSAFLALLIFMTEIFVLIGILMLLLFIEPLGALATLMTLGLSALVYDKFSKKYVKNWGFIRQENEGVRLKHLNEGLNALKEIKISGTHKIFTSKFETNSMKAADMEVRSIVLSNAPKLGLEFLAVLGVFALILTLINQDKALDEIIPTLAIFGVAAFRIMPSINRLINTGQVIRYQFAAIDVLEREISYFKKREEKKIYNSLKFDGIAIENVSFKYPRSKEYILKNINLKIQNKDFIGVVGSSGVGKSTFLNLILGLLEPNKGHIKTNNIDILKNIAEWQSLIGYVPQDVYLLDDTIRNNVAFGLKPNEIDDKKIENALKFSKLDSYLKSLASGINTLVGEKGELISGGQKQRIGLARAIYNEPKILILDEATNALDINTEKNIIKNLRNLTFKPIILMITHRHNSLSLCDYIFEINDGGIKKISKITNA